jgi:hypothetical protein
VFPVRYELNSCYVEESRPPLWSSGQSSWLQIQRFRIRFQSRGSCSEQRLVSRAEAHVQDLTT